MHFDVSLSGHDELFNWCIFRQRKDIGQTMSAGILTDFHAAFADWEAPDMPTTLQGKQLTDK